MLGHTAGHVDTRADVPAVRSGIRRVVAAFELVLNELSKNFAPIYLWT